MSDDIYFDKDVIFSGSQSYCARRSHYYAKLGYVITQMKNWSDGKVTFVMTKRQTGE